MSTTKSVAAGPTGTAPKPQVQRMTGMTIKLPTRLATNTVSLFPAMKTRDIASDSRTDTERSIMIGIAM
jgi:hypothetical protein